MKSPLGSVALVFLSKAWEFFVTAARVDNVLLMSDIRVTCPPCSNTELDARR